jgi:hypothetical protein
VTAADSGHIRTVTWVAQMTLRRIDIRPAELGCTTAAIACPVGISCAKARQKSGQMPMWCSI